MTTKKVDLYYGSDPMCSHCWGLEPHLNKFLAKYGHYVNFHHLMYGLIKSWDEFTGDKVNHIYEPKDTTVHWREFGAKSGMPIDGSLMQDDPVTSSYPASQVFKVLQEIDENIAARYLRKVREALYIHNQNISRREVLVEIVNQLGQDGVVLVDRALTPEYEAKVLEDRQRMKELGTFVTPALTFVNEDNRKFRNIGVKATTALEKDLKRALKVEELKAREPAPLSEWLEKQDVIFAKEIEVMYDLPPEEVLLYIEKELAPNQYELNHIRESFYIKKK